MNYSTSSQRERWTFTKEQLVELREQSRVGALKTALGTSDNECPSSEEEAALLRYYEKTIVTFCRQQHHHLRVQSTALIYLKRFYVHHSSLVHDPSKLFVACIYVASKVEEAYVSMDNLTTLMPNLTENILRKSELKLLKGLEYDLIVHSPFKDIDGLIEDIAQRLSEGKFDDVGLETSDQLSAIRKSAYIAGQCLIETDAPLVHKPSATIDDILSGPLFRQKRLDAYLQNVIYPKLLGTGSSLTKSDLLKELSEIDCLGVEGSQQATLKLENMQHIDRKLKLWIKQHQKSKTAIKETEPTDRKT